MRLFPLVLAATVLAAGPSLAGAKKHHHAAPTAPKLSAKEAQAQALHRIRLAAKEKKEWREHLAKLKSLPHAERIAEKRHERKWQREHDAKVEAMQEAHAEKVAQAKQEAHAAKLEARSAAKHARLAALHPEKAAHGHHHAPKVAEAAVPEPTPRVSAHARRAAALLAAQQAVQRADLAAVQARQSAHARRVAALEAVHQENVAHAAALAQAHAARQAALYALHQANVRAAYAAHLANLQAAHNARVAADRAHWIALHGDGSGGKSIRFWQTAAAGVPVKVISVDLNDPNVKVSGLMARRGNGTSEPFRQMIDRANPNVAVTGTFFSLGDLQPVGDIVIDGSLVHFGGMGTALCVTPDNHADMVTVDWGRHHDWSPYDFVVACGPRLLRRGRVVLDPRAERFRDKHMLSPNSRIAVGITSGNTLFFAMTHEPIYLGRLARVMQSLGASEAMNLDAGTSTGFYYNGATLARPGRQLTNMIVVYGHRDRYERALDQLIPAAYRRTATRYHRQVSSAMPLARQ